jgi:glycosyltransferase involved in cell wall biosynthesis
MEVPTVIDIVMATFNAEPFLAEQMASLLAQSETRWHLYVSDDGSTDRTRSVLHQYIQKYPDKISDVSPGTPYHNVSQNFAHALRHTTAPYLMFADQDDVWYPNKIAQTWAVMQTLDTSRPCLVHTDLAVVAEDLSLIAPSFWRYAFLHPTSDLAELLFQNVVTGCTMMITRSLLDKALPFPEGIFMYDAWIAWAASQFGTIQAVPQTTMQYRQHGHNAVGAQTVTLRLSWDPRAWWELGQSLRRTMHRRIDRTRKQAVLFRQQYADDLTPEALALLDDYIALPTFSFWKKRIVGRKNRFFANSWQTQWGMWLLL